MMNNAETPERPMRPADMPPTMAAPDAAAAFRFPSSSAPVTPSPYVNRAGHSDVKFASPFPADVKGKRLDFVESTPKRQHDQTYNDDEDAEAEEASDRNKKAKISNKIPPGENTTMAAAPDAAAAAAFRFPSSSAPVTPSPYVNRAGHSDVKFASPFPADVKGKRLDFVESTPKRQHDQTYNDDEDAEAEEASDRNKKAKISNKIPPREDTMQAFRALTVYPANEPMSSDDRNKAASHLRNTCLAPDLLRLKTNDRIVTTQKLGDNVPVGTPGKVVGWTSIEDIRCGLSNHIQELIEMKMPADNNNGGSQEEYEIDVSHKHAVDATPAPWYPNILFQGRKEVALL